MRRVALTALIAALMAGCASVVPKPPAELFFDDFSQHDLTALRSSGWVLRTAAGHPGLEGARWEPSAIELVDDADQPGNRFLRLNAHTDGTGANTVQTQLCQQRKFLAGTYAARVRFYDQPQSGVAGDPVIQSFYAVNPLRFDFDPEYSELDWEYVGQGAWGNAKPRIYSVTWETVRLEPWTSYNQAHEEFGSLKGWHVLMMQVADGHTHWFIDGRKVAEHSGRNYPVSLMAISFNLWIHPDGLLPASAGTRTYREDVDWVFHARNTVLSPAEVEAQVLTLRHDGRARVDTVPAPQPALESRCDI
ncbi:MAG TPA: glycoside hydrolase family 16 protein [Burkholderiaceae bacterium]|jgi:hypothetical protein